MSDCRAILGHSAWMIGTTMGSIRVGFFENFRGADTLLIDVDREGLRDLIAWLHEVPLSGQHALLNDCPGAILPSRLRVEVFRVADDTGLVRTDERGFVWRRSEDGWNEIVEKLAAMDADACHQYLDGPRNHIQVMASIGEYGDTWWHHRV